MSGPCAAASRTSRYTPFLRGQNEHSIVTTTLGYLMSREYPYREFRGCRTGPTPCSCFVLKGRGQAWRFKRIPEVCLLGWSDIVLHQIDLADGAGPSLLPNRAAPQQIGHAEITLDPCIDLSNLGSKISREQVRGFS